MKKDILLPLRKLHGRIHERWLLFEQRIELWKYLFFPLGKKIYVIGTPLHTNLGDSAIVLAERYFLQNNGFLQNQIKEITVQEFIRNKKMILSCFHFNKKSFCCWHGGGNFGDQWLSEEKFRREIIDQIINPMIVFPQTIYYTNTKRGYKEARKSVLYYNDRDNLTLVAREKKSYEIMQLLYPDTSVLLIPDIVLSINMGTLGVERLEREGILLCMRNDVEQLLSKEKRMEIICYLQEYSYIYHLTDMYSDCPISKNNRFECVRQKMNEFTSSELVITDRLHGMVFAAITGTPCIVFSNYNHKVCGTYDWIQYLPYIKYVENVEDVKRYIPQLLAMKDCRYDNTPLLPYFEKLAEIVKDYASN